MSTEFSQDRLVGTLQDTIELMTRVVRAIEDDEAPGSDEFWLDVRKLHAMQLEADGLMIAIADQLDRWDAERPGRELDAAKRRSADAAWFQRACGY